MSYISPVPEDRQLIKSTSWRDWFKPSPTPNPDIMIVNKGVPVSQQLSNVANNIKQGLSNLVFKNGIPLFTQQANATPEPYPWTEEPIQGEVKGVSTEATPLPTNAPTRPTNYETYQPGDQYYMDFGGYSGKSSTGIPQPPKSDAEKLFQQLPNEATSAATIAYSENLGYNPSSINDKNRDGTVDYGYFQNNSQTLKEMLGAKKYRDQLNAAGIYKPEDVTDNLDKAIVAYKVTREYKQDTGTAPFAAWYGWQDRGFNPMPEQSLEQTAKVKYPSGNKPYAHLEAFLSGATK